MINATLDKTPLYIVLIDRIEDEIKSGVFKPGDKMYGIGTMCKKYGVSMTTAVRGVNILKERGVLHAIPRKGTYVKGISRVSIQAVEIQPLKRVRVISSQKSLTGLPFSTDIYQGITQACGKYNLPLLSEHVSDDDLLGLNKLSFTPHQEEGVIVLSGMPNLTQQLLLGTKKLRRVLVDSTLPNVPCVLNDNFGGMHQIVEYLQKKGHTHIALSGGVVQSPNTNNENERREAFQVLSKMLNLQGDLLEQRSVPELVEYLRTGPRPTAIIFTRDDPAMEFIKAAGAAGIRVPDDISVVGFDDQSLLGYSTSELSTCHVDCVTMGARAVECLYSFNSDSEIHCRWERVPCHFVERASSL